MTTQHAADIRAEYCFAEGGNVTRVGGKVKFASVQAAEKVPRPIELTAVGPSGHASIPLQSNAIVHLSAALTALGAWRVPIRLNATTRAFFSRMAAISTGAEAARYVAVATQDLPAAAAADDYFLEHEPRYASMLRTSLSPTIVQGGYRSTSSRRRRRRRWTCAWCRRKIPSSFSRPSEKSSTIQPCQSAMPRAPIARLRLRRGSIRRPSGPSKPSQRRTTTPSRCRPWELGLPTWRRFVPWDPSATEL